MNNIQIREKVSNPEKPVKLAKGVALYLRPRYSRTVHHSCINWPVISLQLASSHYPYQNTLVNHENFYRLSPFLYQDRLRSSMVRYRRVETLTRYRWKIYNLYRFIFPPQSYSQEALSPLWALKNQSNRRQGELSGISLKN